MDWQIPLFKIYWDKEDTEAVSKAISRGMNWATGPEVLQFEEKLSEYLGVKYCLVFNSGTSALHALLQAHGIGSGDEVIIPSFTFIATANAPLFVGAKPVFADIEDKTYGLDPEDVERKITSKTKAIIPVHYAGCPCLIEELKEIARRYNLILIEDAAEALGASVNGRELGTIGDSAILSFCQNKIITTGEGGAAVTNSRDIYEKTKLIRSHGRLETADYFSSSENLDYIRLGYNFRMSNLTAALGLAQLSKVEKIIQMRQKNARLMSARLAATPAVITPNPPDGYHHVYQMYSIRVPEQLRNGLIDHLGKQGIMSKVFFYPVHLTSFYLNELKYESQLSVTEEVSRQILSLPFYPSLTEKEIDRITGQVSGFIVNKR